MLLFAELELHFVNYHHISTIVFNFCVRQRYSLLCCFVVNGQHAREHFSSCRSGLVLGIVKICIYVPLPLARSHSCVVMSTVEGAGPKILKIETPMDINFERSLGRMDDAHALLSRKTLFSSANIILIRCSTKYYEFGVAVLPNWGRVSVEFLQVGLFCSSLLFVQFSCRCSEESLQ